VREAGPVRGRIDIVRTFRWPTRVEDDRRVGVAEVAVTTRLELHAGEDLLRVSIEFDNPGHDHRLRLHLPLPEPAQTSEAECAFATVRRGLDAEGGPNEVGLPTYPSRRFVAAGGLLVAHDGLTEYELVDIAGEGADRRAGELAITLLRSVGMLSRGPFPMRSLPAGPPMPTPGAQLVGHHRVDLVLHVGGRNPYAVTDEAFTPMATARFPGRGGLGDPDASGQALAVSGAEVSALRRRGDGRLELRVVNPSDEPSTLTVDGRTGQVTNLRGTPTGETFDGRTDLRPWQILTLVLD
jgi:mannosylglycerate hydrolase